MSSVNRMVKTTAIYFVGNFASKLLTFILLPIYAAYLSTDSFGTVDLIISTLPLIAPVFTLQSTESVFRFICGEENEQKIKVSITNALAIINFGMIVFSVLYIPIITINKYSNSILLYLYFILTYIGIFSQQVARGIKKNKEYAIAGVLTTIIQAVLNIILIVSFKMQAESLLISASAASFVITIYLVYKSNMWEYIDFKFINRLEIISQLKYGIPLIPNQICWWANSAFCKYVLVYFWGSGDNGVFAFASKFPNFIMAVNSIFLLAFVENLIIEYKSPECNEFFSKWFKLFCISQILLVAMLLPVTKIYNILTISSTYSTAALYIPILYVSSLFSSFSAMLGSIYTASMKTVYAFSTTLVSACTNVIFGLLLIPQFGILGVCVANVISSVVFLLVRVMTIRKIMIIKYNLMEIYPTIIILICTLVWYYLCSLYLQMVPIILITAFVFIKYKNELNLVLDLRRQKMKNSNYRK
ncbi:polysaccharide biosynthesis C-terminal domain-containing protein [Ruminiclostridium herbifermentans]|uniref:Polysaccharide biosynthesis C-terminal domain-containing protein n=1 Tax=Ruminiclostridium herbifermentans TaxID=2488810 RepID=A0A4U7JHR7_9FIRM|nr:oligosaccharide flippase family protein [Ruminiclostridium herbifermentans]QNU66604.1 polysaccharide biosynthesis C-terminal domain-containing protein [Ruminiclostridium herbifermentans]